VENDVLFFQASKAGSAKEASRHVASVSAALSILCCFEDDEELSLSEVHRRTGITKSRILRLAGTLESHGFLWTEPRHGGYRLGPALFRLGRDVESRYRDAAANVRPVLERLARESGETALYSVIQAGGRLCVASVEPETSVRFTVPTGVIRPLYAGASGKVLLAFGPDALCRRVLSAPRLESLTERTQTDAGRVSRELEKIRRQGYAISRGEAQPDSYAVAVPVIDGDGRLHGALTIAGPVSRIGEEKESRLLDLLRATAPGVAQSFRFLARRPATADSAEETKGAAASARRPDLSHSTERGSTWTRR
jgi:DNA-binding IclR family transcriptional regulator